MILPVIRNHESKPENIVGWASPSGKLLEVKLLAGFEMDEETLYATFGNIDIEVTKFVRKGGDNLILEFNIKQYILTSGLEAMRSIHKKMHAND